MGSQAMPRRARAATVSSTPVSYTHLNTVGISSRDLANQVPGAVYFETLPEVTTYLRRIARPDDVILTVGAGDIYQAGEALLKQR